MIRGMTVVEHVTGGHDFGRLTNLFAALRFEAGKGWDDGEGKGAAFLAPLGNLELVTGRLPAVPRILVEVTQLEQVHAAVGRWIEAEREASASVSELSAVEATHWNSRLFRVRLSEGLE